MEDKYAKAKHLFVKEKYNCAQAVACAFCQETGIPEEQLRALAASFGGGMGRLREVCGAVSGALLVLGALYGGYDPADTAAKAGHYARVQEFARRFSKAVSYTHLDVYKRQAWRLGKGRRKHESYSHWRPFGEYF